ncbi:hypothetical protein K8I31_04330, partial [bacterium]|nr:hypothetical protein [bacterium]
YKQLRSMPTTSSVEDIYRNCGGPIYITGEDRDYWVYSDGSQTTFVHISDDGTAAYGVVAGLWLD